MIDECALRADWVEKRDAEILTLHRRHDFAVSACIKCSRHSVYPVSMSRASRHAHALRAEMGRKMAAVECSRWMPARYCCCWEAHWLIGDKLGLRAAARPLVNLASKHLLAVQQE